MAKKRWKKVLGWTGAAVLLAVAVDQIWCWNDRRITIGEKTTRITAPLDREYPDYLGALNAKLSAGVTRENNAGPLMLALSGWEDAPQAWIDAVCTRLDISPQEISKEPYLDPLDDWILRRRAETTPATQEDGSGFPWQAEEKIKNAIWDELVATGKKPWKQAEHAEIAAWFSSQRDKFGKLEALKGKSRLYIPFATDDGAMSSGGQRGVLYSRLPPLASYRLGAHLLASRGMQRLGSGDKAGCLADLLLCKKMALLCDEMPHILCHLVALGVYSIASQALIGAAQSGLLSAEECDKYRAAFVGAGELAAPIACFDLHYRYEALDNICAARSLGFTRTWESGPRVLMGHVVPFNIDECLRLANDYCDRLVEAAKTESITDRLRKTDAMKDEMDRIDATQALWTNPSRAYLPQVLPSFGRAVSLDASCRMQAGLGLLSLDLAAYRQRTGAYPADLAALEGGGRKVPMDWFSGQALKYQRQNDGYAAYSVGPDQKDDGGKDLAQSKGDIVIRSGQ